MRTQLLTHSPRRTLQSSKLADCSKMTDCSTTAPPLRLLLTSPVASAGCSLRAGCGTSHGKRQKAKWRRGSTAQKSPTAGAAATGTAGLAAAATTPLISASAAATAAAAAAAAPAPRAGGGHGTRAHPQLPWWGLAPRGKVSAAWHRKSSGGAARERFQRLRLGLGLGLG